MKEDQTRAPRRRERALATSAVGRQRSDQEERPPEVVRAPDLEAGIAGAATFLRWLVTNASWPMTGAGLLGGTAAYLLNQPRLGVSLLLLGAISLGACLGRIIERLESTDPGARTGRRRLPKSAT
jgi:hypothetical protein